MLVGIKSLAQWSGEDNKTDIFEISDYNPSQPWQECVKIFPQLWGVELMNVRYLFVVPLFSLAGCIPAQPLNTVHKEGSTVAERRHAHDICEFEAIKEIPRAMATDITGGYRRPGKIECSTVGGTTTCDEVGGVDVPATSKTYDANAEIRKKFMIRCLEEEGFNIISRPPCRTTAVKAEYKAMHSPQAPASEITCIVP